MKGSLTRIGGATRMALSAQLLLNVLLAAVAAIGAIWLVGRPGVRLRIDVTEKGLNTLSAPTEALLASLREPIALDVFWRGEDKPLDTIAPAGMERVWRLLQLFQAKGGELLRVKSYDAAPRDAVEARLRELKLTGYENCVVLSQGERRAVVPFRGKLVDFDPGDPRRESFRPAAIRSFPAEESLVQALLEVTRGEERKVYFTVGQGERELEDEKERGLFRLVDVLKEEALLAATWDFARAAEVPADCAVLAIVAPQAAFPPLQKERVLQWVDAGGRLLLAGHEDPVLLERSDVPELLQSLGMEIGPGLVMSPAYDSLGNPSFEPQHIVLVPILPQGMVNHPITELLRQTGRGAIFPSAHPIVVRSQPLAPKAGSAFPLLQSPAQVWLDGPPYDYLPDGNHEETGPFALAAVLRFVPASVSGGLVELAEKPEARVVALGGAGLLENDRADRNADLGRNMFRWLASREWRVSISTRDPDERRLPVHQTGVMAGIWRVVMLWIPLFCLAAGGITAFLRSRGGGGRSSV